MKIEITNQGKWQQSLTLKLALLGFLGILFLIPLEMIKSVILERQSTAEQVKTEIANQWASGQSVSGPVLNIPVRSIPEDPEDKSVPGLWHILPETLDIGGHIVPEIRYRGIYQSVVYTSDLVISGEFVIPDQTTASSYAILWKDAYLTLGVSDNRGLKGDVVLKTEDGDIHAEPGVRDRDIFSSGVSFSLPLDGDVKRLSYTTNLKLSGSERLYMIPTGKTTRSHLESEWSSPSFTGSFLPVSREVSEKGFSADWEVTHLNRNFPQNWMDNAFKTEDSSFGLLLFLPVDHYQKSWRSARYGILFIALTFLVLIFLEITRKESIHILHYILVSLGLVLFFSLLNSLSEHTGFNIAYLISSVATITLITFFTGSLFRNRKTALIIAAMLVILYGFIFILLTLNDYAYLAGNVGLFVMLAIIMRLSSRMNVFKREALE